MDGMKELLSLPVCVLAKLLREKKISSAELTGAYLERIEERDKEIHAYITVCAEAALCFAKEIDKKRVCGEALPFLAGIPMAVKDNLCTAHVRTTCASKMLEDFVPPYDATVCRKLQQNGAVLLGKTNLDEFAMGSTGENSAFSVTRNPSNTKHVAGGSSSGSAAAVAAGEAAFSIGTDTGGSVRLPASFCGVVGFKPTYGRISRYGLISFASSMDTVGILSRNIADSKRIFSVVAGFDKNDATSSSLPVRNGLQEEPSVKGIRIGVPKEFFCETLPKEVDAVLQNALCIYQRLGAEIVELSLSSPQKTLAAYYILSSAEASSNLARYDGVRYGYRAEEYTDVSDLYGKTRSRGFGREAKRRILLGTFALSEGYFDAYYQKAVFFREKVKADFSSAFEKCDLLFAPVSPTTAYEVGMQSDPLQTYLGDLYTVPASLAGLPALSVLCGKAENGLPIGMQLIAPAFCEEILFRAGIAFEKERTGNEAV